MIIKTSETNAMLFGMIGLVVMSVLTYSGRMNETWGVTMIIFFGIILISSLLSISPEMPEKVKVLAAKAADIPASTKKSQKKKR